MSKEIAYRLNLQDNTASKLKGFSNNLANVQNQANRSSSSFGKFEQSLDSVGVNATGLTGKFRSLGGLMASPVGVGALAVGAAVGLTALALGTAKVQANMQDLADQTGTNASELSKFRKVAELGNVPMDGLAKGLFKLNKTMLENGEGWRSLGIKTKDPIEAFTQLKERVAAAKSPLEAQAIAMTGLGKAAESVMPLLKMSNEQFREVLNNTKAWSQDEIDAGAKLDDQLVLMKQSFSDLGNTIGSSLIPVVTQLLNLTKETMEGWGAILTSDPRTKLQEQGITVKANAGPRIVEQYLSTKNVGSSEAQSKLGAMSPQQLQDLSAWARIERNDDVLANLLVKMSIAKKEELDIANNKAKKELEAQEKQAKLTEALEAAREKWSDLAKSLEYGKYSEGRKMDEFKAQKLSENASRYAQENPTYLTMSDGYAMGQTLGNLPGYDKSINYGNVNPFNKNNPANRFSKSQEPGKGGYTPEESLNSEQIRLISEAIAKERAELVKANEEWARQKELLNYITGNLESALVSPFESFVKHIGSGNRTIKGLFDDLFSDIKNAFQNMLAQMLAQLMAKAAIFGVLNILSGGGMGVASSALKNFKWFASGTNYAPGGLSYINEKSRGGRELVYMPQGAKVKSDTGSGVVITNHITFTKGMTEEETTYLIDKMNRTSARMYR